MTGREVAPRRAAVVGFAVSVAFHVAILAVRLPAPLMTGSGESSGPETRTRALGVTRLLRLESVERSRPAASSRGRGPSARPELRPPEEPPTPQVPREVAGAMVEASAARLPRPAWIFASDPRLWRRLHVAVQPKVLAHERLVLRARVAELNRATAAATSVVVGMSDWTRVRADGSRWGFSPGRLHIGSTTLPTCLGGGANPVDCGFGILPNRRFEYTARLWTHSEIRRQAARVALERHWKERAKAIRERRDAERRDTIGGTGHQR